MVSTNAHIPSVARPGRLGGFLLSLSLSFLGGLGGMLAVRILITTLVGEGLTLYGDKTVWYLVRSSGTVAYLLLSGATIWGLLLSSKIVQDIVPPALTLGLHNTLAWLSITLAALHAFVLLFERYDTYTITALLVPFIGPYRPAWVALGIIGFYLMLLTSASFSWRKWLGHKRWRALHALTFVAYILVTLHGLKAGSDSHKPGMQAMYLGSGMLVLFLTNYRLLAAPGRRQ